ncbi:MAG: hypothetical protein H5U05_11970, partial [Candidatus Aminicenantes bacterium]|nr:hypothetical protein [Candidatus Aminicenantes bacterium]
MQKHLFSLKKKLNFRQKPLLPGQVIAIVGSVILLMLISAVVANENRPWTVRLDNRVIAVVADKKAAQAAVAEWLGERERNLGQPVNVEGRITFERARRADGAVVDIATFKNVLSREVTVYTRATAIFVNGKKTLVVSDQETAEKLLTSLQEQYTQNSFDRVAFAEDVQLKTIAA